MLNCRSLSNSILRTGVFSNPAVFLGIAAVVALRFVFIYAPFMKQVFDTAALSTRELALSVLVGMIILPVISVEKRPRRPTMPVQLEIYQP